MISNKMKTLVAIVALTAGFADSYALPTIGMKGQKQVLKSTAADCNPATAAIDLDINNVKARLMTGGDMWWDQGTSNAAYEIPKGSRKNALFAGSCWVGGIQNGSLKVAAQLFRGAGNDYWPGPLNYNGGTYEISKNTCNEWDKFWKLDRVLVNEWKELTKSGDRNLISNYKIEKFRKIWEWPARGNGLGTEPNQPTNANDWKAVGSTNSVLEMDDRDYAPFINNNVQGIDNPQDVYNPELGDYPNMEDPGRGDQMVWWVFNDRGNTKLQTKSESIGLEIQTSAFAFSTKDFLNDATFYNYRVINRAGLTLDSAYMATWTDADLGYAFDDYIGSDTARGLGILYNATNIDGHGEPTSYGSNPPMVGVDFFIGPQRYFINPLTGKEDTVKLKMQSFTYFVNSSPISELSDPNNGVEVYFYMTGSRRNGQLFNYDFDGTAGVPCSGLGSGNPIKFVFAGDVNSGWSECVCQNVPGDRRFIHSAGPFQLRPGDVNDIIIGAVWVANAGGCPVGNFKKIRVADDLTQDLFDNNFKTIEGPETPRVVYREMDRKVIFYLQNDRNSTNFMEKYGYEPDSAKYSVRVSKASRLGYTGKDTLYQFEGYRVFQLKNALITPAQIFDENGKLNESVAKEVFQCDIRNGVSQIVNWNKNIDIDGCDSCYTPVIKVNGSDTGIAHSFEIIQDAFAEGDDKRLVNYKTYYFIAIAYAYNNFANFSPLNEPGTQDKPYIESAHGPGGSPLGDQILAVMPNPANGNMGTVLNADYGSGVVITQLEGKGNGGLDIQMSAFSENEAMSAANGYQAAKPIYDSGRGPVRVKVIDPLKVQPGQWRLYLMKDPAATGEFSAKAPSPDTSANNIVAENAKWALVRNGDIANPIYSERNLDALNEQIIEQYGLSLSINQTVAAGYSQVSKAQNGNNNGYITSDITYENAGQLWLAGVPDGEKESPLNWIRSGGYARRSSDPPVPCNANDNASDTMQFYENMFSNNAQVAATWAPYSLAAVEYGYGCGMGVAARSSQGRMFDLHSVDLVFTSDTTKWSRCIVLETSSDGGATTGTSPLAEGGTLKFNLRSHASWNLQMDVQGNPVYSSTPKDTGFSYFPGYAINQETGERLNIVFGEDSYLLQDNGRDMIWNPTSRLLDNSGNPIFGGKHFVYVSRTKYDGCAELAKLIAGRNLRSTWAFQTFMWAGIPLASSFTPMLPLKDGLIPTTTRLRFRVARPYAYYVAPGVVPDNTFNVPGFPKYQFSTDDLAPMKLSDAANPYADDKKKLLDRIHVVPNPYYAYNGYEKNRLDTRVRIINLPRKATINVYSLDGSVIKTITKDDDLPYIDWDIRNMKGMTIASGMYLIHVKADGIGERVVKWFGAMRPVDVNSY